MSARWRTRSSRLDSLLAKRIEDVAYVSLLREEWMPIT
jgi:hypothetical protein